MSDTRTGGRLAWLGIMAALALGAAGCMGANPTMVELEVSGSTFVPESGRARRYLQTTGDRTLQISLNPGDDSIYNDYFKILIYPYSGSGIYELTHSIGCGDDGSNAEYLPAGAPIEGRYTTCGGFARAAVEVTEDPAGRFVDFDVSAFLTEGLCDCSGDNVQISGGGRVPLVD